MLARKKEVGFYYVVSFNWKLTPRKIKFKSGLKKPGRNCKKVIKPLNWNLYQKLLATYPTHSCVDVGLA